MAYTTKSLQKQFGLDEDVISILRICQQSAQKCAKEDNREINIDLPFLCELWINQNGRCAVSNKPLGTKTGSHKYRNNDRSSVDRIDSAKGYTKDNVRLLCWQSNNGIGAGSDDEYFSTCESVYFHQLWIRIKDVGVSKVLSEHVAKLFAAVRQRNETTPTSAVSGNSKSTSNNAKLGVGILEIDRT